MKRKNLERISKGFLLVVLFQVFLLMNLSVANSYLIHQTDIVLEKAAVEADKDFNVLNYGLNLLIGFISIDSIGTVSAGFWADTSGSQLGEGLTAYNYTNVNTAEADNSIADVHWQCCPVATNGAICQEQSSTLEGNECAVPVIPTSCENVGSCELGCCVDPVEGVYDTNSPRQACEVGGGDWYPNPECLIPEAQRGCCLLGGDVEFVTEQRCVHLSALNGFGDSYFEDVQTEIQCLALKEEQAWGACITEGGRCGFITELECAEANGNFHENLMCSSPTVNSTCEKQTSVGCAEGKDEIYWFDSCGNRENIYEGGSNAAEDRSWNSGMFLAKNDSCNPLSNNADSTNCGNCNYLLGSTCSEALSGKKVVDGDFICRDLSCIDEDGNERNNGESWCVYDSSIGAVEGPSGGLFGSDAVGSRHWKRSCIDGEIKAEGCADYRGQICVESEIDIANGEKFNGAACVMNEAFDCILEKNKDEASLETCAENKACFVKEIDVDKGFAFDMCVPKYPRGFDLTPEGQEESNSPEQICGFANQKCIVVYEKKIRGWECIFNCECEEETFAEQMNELCVSLGDCGSYINYEGDGTDNIKVENSPKISWQEYIGFEKPVEGQHAEPQDIEDILEQVFGIATDYDPNEQYETGNKIVKTAGTIVGGLGTITTIAGLYAGFGATATSAGTLAGAEAVGAILGLGGPSFSLGAFGGAAAGAGIGMLIGAGLAKAFGLGGQGALILMIAGGVAGAVVGLMVAGAMNAWNPVGWAIILIAILIMIVTIVLGIGKTKEVVVKFTCMPWQAPSGGDNCGKCHEDPLRPCTEYRCSSLGAGCELLNPGDPNPICHNPNEDDSTPPVITPGQVISPGYRFENEETNKVEIRTSEGTCIPAFTSVLFNLETDEFAQCKFDFERKGYDELEQFFAEQTSYTLNHTSAFVMPSIAALEAEYNISITGTVREQLANLDMFVKCQDTQGNRNNGEFAVNFCIRSGPDETPVEITMTRPATGATKRFGVTELPLTVYTNEPANCKFDIEDKSYFEMANPMICETGLMNSGLYGWPCEGVLTNLTDDDYTAYIRCLDQPWLDGTVNESQRNPNEESYVLEITSSSSELSLDSLTVNGQDGGNVIEGFEPIVVKIEAKTSGGIGNGISQCEYSFIGFSSDMIPFKESLSNTHKQTFDLMSAGDYNFYVNCEDNAGNAAQGNLSFSLNLDTAPPIAVRVFNKGGQLTVLTNEEAECYYDLDRCEFSTVNATSMTTGFSNTHTVAWDTDVTYHIKCKDIFGNTNQGCAIKATPSSLY